MAISAGEIISAGRVARLQTAIASMAATSALAMTDTTETDIPGASVTIVTTANNATYKVVATFDASVTTTNATTLMIGKLQVDGVSQTGTAIFAMDTALRATVVATWTGTLATAGSHTFKLRGNLSAGAAGTASFIQTNTAAVIDIVEVA